jgi:predicted DNA-binding protein (MmcQ/YjbR family)
MVLTNHHGDGRFAIWCAAAPGIQHILVEGDAEKYFVPPYVGYRGWLGVSLDGALDWNELAGIVEDAYAEVAPPKLVEAARRL